MATTKEGNSHGVGTANSTSSEPSINNCTSILEEYWDNGLSEGYRKEDNKRKISELVQKTGLSSHRIKKWINNRRTKERRMRFGRPKRLSINPKKKHAYHCFMSDYLTGNVSGSRSEILANASKAWKSAKRSGDTASFQRRANELNETGGSPLTPAERKKLQTRIFQEIQTLCLKLEHLGAHTFVLSATPEGGDFVGGTEKAMSFFETDGPQLRRRFSHAMSGGMTEQPDPAKSKEEIQFPAESREGLRRQVQELFNRAYRSATGKNRMSYPLAEGHRMEGLPPGLTLKKPSAYGVPALKEILQHAGAIHVVKTETACEEEEENPVARAGVVADRSEGRTVISTDQGGCAEKDIAMHVGKSVNRVATPNDEAEGINGAIEERDGIGDYDDEEYGEIEVVADIKDGDDEMETSTEPSVPQG